tara:strand:- start:842 stop:1177 length:336 start_codon:yes stop_codon:yes gene_type:complete
MAHFDEYLSKIGKDAIYTGNPPTSKEDYEARIQFPDGVTRPTWEEVQAGTALEECRDKRLNEYLGGQHHGGLHVELEKLWDDIDAGKFGEAAKTGKFYTDVKTIKEKYPKP